MTERRHAQSQFYESLSSETNLPFNFNDSLDNRKAKSLRPSRQLPKWTWNVLVHILGIKRHGEKCVPCLSIILQSVLLLLACTFTITGMVHTVYDVHSKFSSTTLVIGCVNIILGFGWIALGIYSHKLASRLFTNRNFAESVRIHSRTFFKISAAGLLMVLSTAVIVLNCYNDYKVFGPDHCDKIFLHPAVCHVMYGSHVAFSAMALLWNVLVGCVLLSVCRTHTIGIRRFIKQLEDDARAMEDSMSHSSDVDFISTMNGTDGEWFIWNDHIQSDMDRQGTFSEGINNENYSPPTEDELQQPVGNTEDILSEKSDNENQNAHVQTENAVHNDTKAHAFQSAALSSADILNYYWKISNRMRITSQYLQRWFASWAVYIFIWCADFVVYWLSKPATVIDILEFSIPLILLFIVTVAYAECNGEGQRMIRCIYPTTDRMKILDFLNKQPLQMQVFSFTVTYNTIFGVVLAFVVAFASRIILDEMGKL